MPHPPQISSDSLSRLCADLSGAGAELKTTNDGLCDMTVIEFHRKGDKGMRIQDAYNKWAVSQEGDPLTFAVCAPPGNVVSPAPESVLAVGVEAYSVLHAYQGLTIAAFDDGAVPAVPLLGGYGPFVNIHHAAVAANKLLERIANPGPGFPAINSVGAGTYLATVSQQYTNVLVVIHVYKV